MAVVNTTTSQSFLALRNSNSIFTKSKPALSLPLSSYARIAAATIDGVRTRLNPAVAVARPDGVDCFLSLSDDSADQQGGVSLEGGIAQEEEKVELEEAGLSTSLGGFAFESSGSGGGAGELGFSSLSSTPGSLMKGENHDKTADQVINASIVLAAGTFAITKLLTIDMDYWHGWTFYEIVRYAPQHNWTAYEEALKTNPVLAKMMISGVVYSIGDWIAQCYAGKPIFDFDRARMLRSGLTGFALHGSLSHYYYEICELLFPFHDWWVVPVKVAFDQTIWSAIWNSIYFVVLGFLRFESPANIFRELKATFWPMLTAGWKLWPFAHLITYGVIPVEQRLLWVDCVELVWVMILSTYSNEKSESRHTEGISELSVKSQGAAPEEITK